MGFHEEQAKAVRIRQLAKESAVLIGEKRGAQVPGSRVEAGLDMRTNANALMEESNRLQDSMFRTLFMGTFKNGKSTTVNAILGKEMLPAKATAATAVISQVRYGTDTTHVKIFREGQDVPERLTLDEFFRQYQLTEEDEQIIEENGELDRFSDIDHVEMESDLPLFSDGLQFIDSPGLEEASSRTKTTDRYVPKANAIIFLLDATKLFSEKEKSYVRTHFAYAEPRPRNVFFLVNRFNQLNTDADREHVRKSATAHLKPVFTDANGVLDEGLMSRRVFYVNAYKALEDRKAGRAPEGTGMIEFQTALEEFLTSNDRIIARYQPLLANMANICAEVDKGNAAYQKAMSLPLETLRQNEAKAKKDLEELEDKVESIRSTVQHTEKLVEMKILNSLDQFVSTDLPAAWSKEKAKYDRKLGIVDMVKIAITRDESRRRAILQPMVDFLNSFVEEQMQLWGNSISLLIQPEMDDMQAELESQTDAFSIRLDDILGAFSGLGPTVGTGGGANKVQLALSLIQGDFSVAVDNAAGGNFSWGEYIKKYVVQLAINMVLLSLFSGGMFYIVLAAVEALQIKSQGSKRTEQILDSMANEVFPRIRESMNQQRPAIEQNIRRQFDSQADAACAVAMDMIRDVQRQMQRMVEEKKNSEAESGRELQRRQEIRSDLFKRTSEIYKLVYGPDKELTEENLGKLAAMSKKSGTV